jgi:DNA-binding CsgD family transcriptional regulator
MTAVWGRCREDGGAPPFLPWVQIVRAAVEAAGPPGGRWGPGWPDVASLIDPVPGTAREPADAADRFRLFASLASVLGRVAGTHGMLAVLDDLHRADEGSLAFLRYLVPELADLPILLLAAYRESEVHGDHPLVATIGSIADGSTVPVMRLEGLAGAEVAALIDRHAGPVAAEVVGTVAARTGGNPLFVIELAVLLRTTHGDLSAVASTAIPPTVREVINQRIARLPFESRQALRAAAVLGRDFGRLRLAELLGASELVVAAALQPAIAVRLISPGAADGYRFVHALIQAAVYEAIDVRERVELHRRAAAAIAALGTDDDETISDLAFHSYHASLDGDPGPALRYTRVAGRRARQRLAFGEAARWLSLALELADRRPPNDDDHLELLFEAAEADVCAGLGVSARARFERAAEIARQRQDADALTRAALGVGSAVVQSPGKVDWELVALLEQAAAAAVDDAARARLESRRAIELYWSEGGEPARADSRLALRIAERSGDQEALGVALVARQFTLRGPERLDERIATGERLLALAREWRHAELEFKGTLWLSVEVLITGDLCRFRSLVGSLDGMAARSRLPVQRWYTIAMKASLAAIEGRVEEAFGQVDAAAALGKRLGLELALVFRLGELCVLCREREGLAGLSPEIEEASSRLPYITLRSLVSLAAATTGHLDAAAWEVDRLSGDCFAVVPRDSLWVATIALLTESAAISASPHTRQLIELLSPHRGTLVVQGIPNCWGSVDRFIGRAHLALDEYDEARQNLTSALAIESRIGAPLFVARTKLDLARLAMLTGDRHEAGLLVAATTATADRLGLSALSAEAAQVLAPRTGSAVLSRREEEVLGLVSGGATNKEIAATLVISLNTVERHLANIYRKLRVRGRAEAAAYAVRAGLKMVTRDGGLP